MPDKYQIREAREEDVEELVRMRLDLQKHMSQNNPYIFQLSQKRISRLSEFYLHKIGDRNSKLLVIEDNRSGSVIGMGLGTLQMHDEYVPSNSGKIDDIWVEPRYRLKGLLKNLLLDLLEFFKSKGIESLTLNYVQGNREAEVVWKKLGFKTAIKTAVADRSEVVNNCE